MDKDKRTGWLAELKVGDKVFIEHWSFQGLGRMTIDKITPTGRIICGNSEFDHDGWRRGSTSLRRPYLTEATKETVARWRRQQCIYAIENWMRDGIQKAPLETLEAVAKLVREAVASLPKEKVG